VKEVGQNKSRFRKKGIHRRKKGDECCSREQLRGGTRPLRPTGKGRFGMLPSGWKRCLVQRQDPRGKASRGGKQVRKDSLGGGLAVRGRSRFRS